MPPARILTPAVVHREPPEAPLQRCGRFAFGPGLAACAAPCDHRACHPAAQRLPERRADQHHRRAQHHRRRVDPPRRHRTQRDMPAHRMGDQHARARRLRAPLPPERHQIVFQYGEVVEVAGIADPQPPRPALPAPIKRRDAPSVGAQVQSDIEVLFQHIGPPALHQHPSPPAAGQVEPAMVPAVGRAPAAQPGVHRQTVGERGG